MASLPSTSVDPTTSVTEDHWSQKKPTDHQSLFPNEIWSIIIGFVRDANQPPPPLHDPITYQDLLSLALTSRLIHSITLLYLYSHIVLFKPTRRSFDFLHELSSPSPFATFVQPLVDTIAVVRWHPSSNAMNRDLARKEFGERWNGQRDMSVFVNLLPRLPNLRRLHFYKTFFSYHMLYSLAPLSQLEELSLDDCSLWSWPSDDYNRDTIAKDPFKTLTLKSVRYTVGYSVTPKMSHLIEFLTTLPTTENIEVDATTRLSMGMMGGGDEQPNVRRLSIVRLQGGVNTARHSLMEFLCKYPNLEVVDIPYPICYPMRSPFALQPEAQPVEEPLPPGPALPHLQQFIGPPYLAEAVCHKRTLEGFGLCCNRPDDKSIVERIMKDQTVVFKDLKLVHALWEDYLLEVVATHRPDLECLEIQMQHETITRTWDWIDPHTATPQAWAWEQENLPNLLAKLPHIKDFQFRPHIPTENVPSPAEEKALVEAITDKCPELLKLQVVPQRLWWRLSHHSLWEMKEISQV